MRRQRIIRDIPLVTGINAAADSKLSPVGSLLQVENFYFDKDASLARPERFKTVALTDISGASVSNAISKVCEYDGRPVICTGGNNSKIYEFDDTLDRVVTTGVSPACGAPEKQILARDTYASACQTGCCVTDSGYQVVVWVNDLNSQGSPADGTDISSQHSPLGELWASVYGPEGTLLFRELLAGSNASHPRIIGTGDIVYIYYLSGSSSPYTLVRLRKDLSTVPTTLLGSSTNLTTDVDGTEKKYDACDDGSGSSTAVTFVAAYTATAPKLKIWRYDSSGTQTHTTSFSEDATTALGIGASQTSSSDLVVGWSDGTGTFALMVSTTNLGTNLAKTTLQLTQPSYAIAWVATNSTTWYFGASQKVVASDTFRTQCGTLTTSGTVTLHAIVQHLTLASRLYRYGTGVYAVLLFPCSAYNSSELNSAWYLCELPTSSTTMITARLCAALATNGAALITLEEVSGSVMLNSVYPVVSQPNIGSRRIWVGPEVFTFPATITIGGYTQIAMQSGVASYTWTHDDEHVAEAATLGDLLYLSGGVCTQYDGEVCSEVGFAYAPMAKSLTKSGTGNNYQYIFTYVWEDSHGNLHESAPSKVSSLTNVGAISSGATASIVVTSLGLTNKNQIDSAGLFRGRKVSVRTYRTIHNGSVFLFVNDTASLPTDTTITVTDGASDAQLAGRIPVYVDGGVLPNSQPVAASHVSAWDNRIFASNGKEVRFTKQWTIDRAPQFVDDATHAIEVANGGEITSVTGWGDGLVIGKEDRIYVQSGTGPSQQGLPPYPEPRLFTVDSGVIDSRSVVAHGQGLYYWAAQGIYRIPAGFGSPQWIGAAVRSEFPEERGKINGACLNPERSLVIWSLTSVFDDDPKLLVYDYARNAWSMWRTPSDQEVRGIVSIDGNLWLGSGTTAGRIYQQYVNTWLDDTGAQVSFITTNKWRVSDHVSGDARLCLLRIVGSYHQNSKLKVEMGVDDASFNSAYDKTWTITANDAGDRFEREYVLPWQKGQSHQFRITVTGDGVVTLAQGLTLNGLSLEYAPGRTGRPLREAQRG